MTVELLNEFIDKKSPYSTGFFNSKKFIIFDVLVMRLEHFYVTRKTLINMI